MSRGGKKPGSVRRKFDPNPKKIGRAQQNRQYPDLDAKPKAYHEAEGTFAREYPKDCPLWAEVRRLAILQLRDGYNEKGANFITNSSALKTATTAALRGKKIPVGYNRDGLAMMFLSHMKCGVPAKIIIDGVTYVG